MGKELPAHERLLDAVEQYFVASCPPKNSSDKVFRTSLPPIYFQHPGIIHLMEGYIRVSCLLTVLRPFNDNRGLREAE